jgi:uncharacterized iron-regulated protein
MKKNILISMLVLLMSLVLHSQSITIDKPAFVIFSSTGEQISYHQMIQIITMNDICLFGELHNDPISHWLEKEIVKSLYEIKKDSLKVGAEMWETDNQLLLDEAFVNNFYDQKMYLESSKLWPNLETDYLPVLEYCIQNSIKFVATNIPRRYARMVSKLGIESLNQLSEQAKSYIAPLPIVMDLNEITYKNMVHDMPTGGGMKMGNPENIAKAQAVKDATMAHFILKNLKQGELFFHFNGEFHSANYSGIMYYLKSYNKNISIKTISIIQQKDIIMLENENKNRADIIIVVPEDMNTTY